MTACLLGSRGGEEIRWRQLDRVRVKIRNGQILVLGFEDHGFSAKSPKPVPQVWWPAPGLLDALCIELDDVPL